jgi:alkyl sulfatase BDS1-like metallo-beta-lactamase superfamily hydrolase
VVSQADAAAGKTKVIAPADLMEAVIGEAATGGNAKARRGQYQFGMPLPVGERGNVDEGLGKNERLSGSERGRTDYRTKRYHSAADGDPDYR